MSREAPISLRLPEILRNRIAEHASVEERSFSGEIIFLLEFALNSGELDLEDARRRMEEMSAPLRALVGSEGKDGADTEAEPGQGRKAASETRDAPVNIASSDPASATGGKKTYKPDFRPESSKKKRGRRLR